MMLCPELNTQIQTWLRDYDKIQSFAVILIYIQIACALIGSMGALYNGVSLANLGIGLFALVAIESSSQSLGRTYAVLLFSAILLDILWFILFSHEIWFISSEIHGEFAVFSVRSTLLMQIIGFTVRSSSSLLWIQMYRLGPSLVDNPVPRGGDLDLRNSFMNPATPPVIRRTSGSGDALGGSIFDPSFYSSLFSDNQDEGSLHPGHNHRGGMDGSLSDSLLKPTLSKSFQATHLSYAGKERSKQAREPLKSTMIPIGIKSIYFLPNGGSFLYLNVCQCFVVANFVQLHLNTYYFSRKWPRVDLAIRVVHHASLNCTFEWFRYYVVDLVTIWL